MRISNGDGRRLAMMSDTGRSLEVDGLDRALEPTPSAPPVVVVQYRDRGVPLWLLIPLVIIVPMSAILVYHRWVVVSYRAQAELARQALESQIEQGQPDVPKPVASKPSDPLALNSQPFVSESAKSVAATTPTTPIGSQTLATAGAVAKWVESASQKPGPAQPKAGSGSDAVDGLLSMPAVDKSAGVAVGNTTRPPAKSILEDPIITLRQPGKATAPLDVAKRSTAGETASKKGKGPFENSRGESAPKPGELAAEPAGDIPGTSGTGAVVDVKVEPLPTKEESLRQIEEEAEKKQAEIDGLEANKQAEFRSMRQSERLKFRDELRQVLQSFGNSAGPEIDKLAKRYGYDMERVKLTRALNTWKFAGKSTQAKVRFTRSLDLPETAILHFLIAELTMKIGSREGPRDQNEVRIRAAKMLLSFELPAEDATTATPVQPVRPNPGVASTKTPQRTTSGSRVVSRPR
jgi:hypothetical protein